MRRKPRYEYRLDYRRERRKLPLILIRRLALLALFGILFYTISLFWFGGPSIANVDEFKFIPARGEKLLKINSNKDIKHLEVKVIQDGKVYTLFSNALKTGEREVKIPVNAVSLGLKEGPAEVVIDIKAGFFASRNYKIESYVDTKPPTVSIVGITQELKQGGSGAIKVRVDDGDHVSLKVNGVDYNLYKVGDKDYFGIYPVDIEAENLHIEVFAKDKAGNYTVVSRELKVRSVKFKQENIEISDRLINEVILPLLNTQENITPEEAFKRVNETWREENAKTIMEIGKKSESRKLWEGAFLQLPNSKVISTYGDIRNYFYKGKHISTSRHLGYDFASVEMATVPAGNSGVVVFAGDLGIYGNTVIIDHGLGVMSLYGHLSQIDVKEGQYVKKGEAIGKTGKTGLALGDHLHFGILVQGREVNPVEWLDGKWIDSHVESLLKAR